MKKLLAFALGAICVTFASAADINRPASANAYLYLQAEFGQHKPTVDATKLGLKLGYRAIDRNPSLHSKNTLANAPAMLDLIINGSGEKYIKSYGVSILSTEHNVNANGDAVTEFGALDWVGVVLGLASGVVIYSAFKDDPNDGANNAATADPQSAMACTVITDCPAGNNCTNGTCTPILNIPPLP